MVYGTGEARGVRITSWTAPDPTSKLGLTNTLDAEVQVTPYQQAMTRAAGATMRVSGWGDTVVRLKANLLGDDGGAVAVALLPYVKIPTARSGLGNGSVEGGFILPVSFSAPAGFTVVVMPEIDALKDTAGAARHAAFDFLVNVSHPLTRRWNLYSEVFTTQSTPASDKPVYVGRSPHSRRYTEPAARFRRELRPEQRTASRSELCGLVPALLGPSPLTSPPSLPPLP